MGDCYVEGKHSGRSDGTGRLLRYAVVWHATVVVLFDGLESVGG